MSLSNNTLLRIAGLCGILSPLFAFTCILSAIAYYPAFSWTHNALSDLGVQNEITSALFNYGLEVSGILALVFAFGLFRLLGRKPSGKASACLFTLSALALIMIGFFNENYGSIHGYVSIAFFMLFPLSMLFAMISFLRSGELKMGGFTFLVAAASVAPWVAFSVTRFVEGVALPEVISALSASTWLAITSVKMLIETAHPTEWHSKQLIS